MKQYFKAIAGIFLMITLVTVMVINSTVNAKACIFFNKVDINLYTGNDNVDGFDVEVVKTRLTAKKIIKELQKKGAVAKGVKVKSFSDKGTLLELNLSREFENDILRTGTAGEYIKIGCVVNTFLDAYDAERILLQVEGSSWATGHSVIDKPLQMFKNYEEQQGYVKTNIYCANDDVDALIANSILVESITPENLMNELQIYSGIPKNVQIYGFENNNGALVLDLSQEFENYVSSFGTTGEYIAVGCVVNTFLDAYNASQIIITVNGEAWATGHSVYDFPLTRFN